MRSQALLSGILFICSILTATTAFALPTFQFFVEDSSQPSPKNVGFVISVGGGNTLANNITSHVRAFAQDRINAFE